MFIPGGELTVRELFWLLEQLPDDSAFVASMRARPPSGPAGDSPRSEELRTQRRHRGWTLDRELLARIGDILSGKSYPRPDSPAGGGGGGWRVLDLDDVAAFGI